MAQKITQELRNVLNENLYRLTKVYRSEVVVVKGKDVVQILRYWILNSKDFVPSIECPFSVKRHQRWEVTMMNGEKIKCREVYVLPKEV